MSNLNDNYDNYYESDNQYYFILYCAALQYLINNHKNKKQYIDKIKYFFTEKKNHNI